MTKAELQTHGYTFSKWRGGSGVRYVGVYFRGMCIGSFANRNFVSQSIVNKAVAHMMGRRLTGELL